MGMRRCASVARLGATGRCSRRHVCQSALPEWASSGELSRTRPRHLNLYVSEVTRSPTSSPREAKREARMWKHSPSLCFLFGNPADHRTLDGPVALRPRIAPGLPVRRFLAAIQLPLS